MSKYVYKTKPWEHQKKALSYLYRRNTAALYTDMGSGKTKVMIDLIQSRHFNRVLVVAPYKACEVWEEQIHKHGLRGLLSVLRLNECSIVKVINELKKLPKWEPEMSSSPISIIILNYEKIWRKGIENILQKKSFGLDCIICDESHRIKSPQSKCSMCLARLGKVVTNKYLVTGTPLAEKPTDVFAQYKFLDPSIFGSTIGPFRERYENLDVEMTSRIGHRILDKNQPYKNLEELHEKMFSCAFYIKSSVKLPEQTDIIWNVSMPSKTEKLYHEFLKEKVSELNGMWMESNNALTTGLRLQQITSGFSKVEDIDTKEKHILNLDTARQIELKQLLELFPVNEPIVIFAHFKKDIKNIRKVCKELQLSYSEVSGSNDTLQDWKKGLTQILVVQYSSGSESIDLTRARYCIYYSQTQRLALYEQSRKRIHRPGQTRPVVYYHMISTMKKGQTIDQKIFLAHKHKKDLVDYIMLKGWD